MEQIVAAIIGGLFLIIATIIGMKNDVILFNFFRFKSKLPKGFIIIINGGSGVGKTTIAWALAIKYKVATVIETNTIRETLRDQIENCDNSDKDKDVLLNSSFLAHCKSPTDILDGEKSKVIDAFKKQCEFLLRPLVRVINRVRMKQMPAIIEGINVISSQLYSDIPSDPHNKILFVNLSLKTEKSHLERLRLRGTNSGEPPELTDRYIKNIKSIREIDDFCKKDTEISIEEYYKEGDGIISIDNSGTVSQTVKEISKHIKKKIKLLKKANKLK